MNKLVNYLNDESKITSRGDFWACIFSFLAVFAFISSIVFIFLGHVIPVIIFLILSIFCTLYALYIFWCSSWCESKWTLMDFKLWKRLYEVNPNRYVITKLYIDNATKVFFNPFDKTRRHEEYIGSYRFFTKINFPFWGWIAFEFWLIGYKRSKKYKKVKKTNDKQLKNLQEILEISQQDINNMFNEAQNQINTAQKINEEVKINLEEEKKRKLKKTLKEKEREVWRSGI